MNPVFSIKDGKLKVHIYFHLLPKIHGTDDKGFFRHKHKAWGEK